MMGPQLNGAVVDQDTGYSLYRAQALISGIFDPGWTLQEIGGMNRDKIVVFLSWNSNFVTSIIFKATL